MKLSIAGLSTTSLRRLLFVAMVSFIPHHIAKADQIPLTVEVDVSSSFSRSGGPIPLTIHVNYFGSQPGLAGNLAFNLVTTDGSLMATYLFEGLYLPKGQQTFEFLLQPPTSGIWQDGYDFYPIFHTDSGKQYRLPEQLLRLPGASRRSFVITIATEADDEITPLAKQLGAELSFETRMPGFDATRPSSRPVITLLRSIGVQNFPTQPLSHCVSDLVLLPDEMFSRLNERQANALLAWVKAGGSLAVFLDESKPLSSSRMEFLNSLLNAEADSPEVYQLSTGALQFSDSPEAQILLKKNGLGRVAVMPSPRNKSLANDLGATSFRELYIHLWKVRKEQQREILDSESGEWSFEPAKRYTVLKNPNFTDINDPGIHTFTQRFRATPTEGGNGLLEETLPLGMQMLPLWVIGTTLFLYILAIGPFDYFLLGSLGLRKYTWVLFPVMTVLFTAGAIVTANYKMRGSNDGGRVVIRDISASGEIVRENEISTYLPSSGGEKVFDAKRQLLTPIDPFQLGVNYQIMQYQDIDYVETPPVFRGRFPVEAQLVRQVHKWSPEMIRTLKIPLEPEKESSGFDWSIKLNPKDGKQRQQLATRLQAAFGQQVNARLIRRNGRNDANQNPSDRNEEVFDNLPVCGSQEILVDSTSRRQYQRVTYATGSPYYSDTRNLSFLNTSALREEAGMYSVVSQLSPKCDDFLEDLPVLDPTDENSWLLLVTVQKGNHWDIYRQLIETE